MLAIHFHFEAGQLESFCIEIVHSFEGKCKVIFQIDVFALKVNETFLCLSLQKGYQLLNCGFLPIVERQF